MENKVQLGMNCGVWKFTAGLSGILSSPWLSLPHEKCYFLLDMDFLVNKLANLTLNFTWQKVCFLFPEWFQVCKVLADEWPTLEPLESVAVLGPNVMFSEAHNISMLLVCYLLLDTHSIFFRVEFGNRLSQFWKTGTRHKNLPL
jgi:hypothetical protein